MTCRRHTVIAAVAAVAALSAGGAVAANHGTHGTTSTTTVAVTTTTVTVAPSGVIVADVPGVTDPAVTQANIATTICVRGYTATVRPPVSFTNPLKLQLLKSHGYSQPASAFELDHLISLELGGAPSDPNNLWLEPHPRADVVDRIENQLHAQLCNGQLTLADAQAQIVQLKHVSG